MKLAVLGAGWRASARGAWSAFWSSRLVVFGAAVYSAIGGFIGQRVTEYRPLIHPFAAWPATPGFDLLFSRLTKWDAVHYISIAVGSYGQSHPGLDPIEARPAFFPLYPGIVRVFSGFAASRGLALIVAYVVSLACFFGALTLLHRLTTIEVGERLARPTLMLLAFFPAALFYGIPYSESLFLLLAVSAFLAARTGHWALAGIVLALASASRFPGLLLVVPVAIIYLYGPRSDATPEFDDGLWPRYRLRWNMAWLLLAPVGLIAFSVYLHFAVGNALAWNDAQAVFGRHTVDPFSGAWAGVREAGESVWQLAHGNYVPSFTVNLMQFVAVVFWIVAGIGVLRMLPFAYGTWVLLSIVPTFISQRPDLPFWSSPRFVAVLFPIFIWLAAVCERRRWTTTVIALSAAGMAVLTVQFCLWNFVA
jgi:hypothetical protein